MKVAFVKLDRQKKGLIKETNRMLRKIFHIIKRENEIFYIPYTYKVDKNIIDSECEFKEIKKRIKMQESKDLDYNILISKKIINKLTESLKKNNYEYAICENEIELEYKKMDGHIIEKYMIPEIISKIEKDEGIKYSQIYICTNEYNENLRKMIIEFTNIFKIVNIVTFNRKYRILEKELSNDEIEITVLNNKRRTLKNAELVVNIDLKNFNEYNINRYLTMIDLANNTELPKGFMGKYINKVNVKTSKMLRIFDDFENFNEGELIEEEISKIEDYTEARKYINNNKIQII